MSNNADGKHVVIENGQRVSETMDKKKAEEEVAKRKSVSESGGSKGSKNVEVKTNLYG